MSKLQYLKIYRKSKKNDTFQAMVNPSTISYSTAIKYVKENPIGTTKTENKFDGYEDETISFTLILDGTGIIGKSSKTVVDSIKKFKAIAYEYNGDTHEPEYVMIDWGDTVYLQGKLQSFSIEYKLFTPDGHPLRADMQVSFVGATTPREAAAKESKSSPDLTHVRVVKAGDTLPMMCQNIYKNSAMYIEVAKINGLVNFRKLEPGSEIIFPPLKK